jgi:hypothetical protein
MINVPRMPELTIQRLISDIDKDTYIKLYLPTDDLGNVKTTLSR